MSRIEPQPLYVLSMSNIHHPSAALATAERQQKVSRELWLVFAIAAVLGSTWWVSRLSLIRPESDLGYALGVTGGTMMLLLFAYPLRKRVPFMQAWGKTRYWFWWHMVLGILGPTAILLHASYDFGSLNATVAFSAMACVSLSGVFGRFVYARIHHGLYGRRATLKEMQQALGLAASQGETVLANWPGVQQRLQSLEADALRDRTGLGRIWHFWVLPVVLMRARWECGHDLSRHAASQTQARQAQQAVARYLHALGRTARFRAYERMFALWHVLHAPLVWMLVLCAVAHVVAVHIY